MIPVLVTGGAGYIGSHTCKLLARSGFVPIVLDNLSTGHPWAVKYGPLVVGDLADLSLLRQVMRDYRVEGVIHFAASAYVGESMAIPQKYFRNNVVNTLNLLDAMRDTGVSNIVFSSTCATYGVPDTIPIPETQPQRPTNPYGDSKLFVERALGWNGEAHGLRWIALRYFNAAGADPEGELGEDHDPETHLIPLAIQAALGERPYLEIFGTDYPTADGTAVRDYIHVADLAQAHTLALQYLLSGGKSRAFNLGVGRGYSVLQVIATVERVLGAHVPVRREARRGGDPPKLVADARLAAKTLNWRPAYRELGPIVDTACRWFAARSTARLPVGAGIVPAPPLVGHAEAGI